MSVADEVAADSNATALVWSYFTEVLEKDHLLYTTRVAEEVKKKILEENPQLWRDYLIESDIRFAAKDISYLRHQLRVEAKRNNKSRSRRPPSFRDLRHRYQAGQLSEQAFIEATKPKYTGIFSVHIAVNSKGKSKMHGDMVLEDIWSIREHRTKLKESNEQDILWMDALEPYLSEQPEGTKISDVLSEDEAESIYRSIYGE